MKKLRCLSLTLIVTLLCNPMVMAFHAPPWDTGHQSFTGDPGDQNTDPGNDSCNSKGSPIELATGNFIYSAQDLFIPGVGPSLSVTRTYNSQDRRNGLFGEGWSFSYENRLIETTDGSQQYATCRDGDGKRLRFVKNPDNTYKPPADNFASLSRNPDQTRRIMEKSGIERRFDTDGKLLSVSDRNGNTLTLTYDSSGFLTSLTDARGRSALLTKGANGKVESLRDPAGRVLSYGYDAAGNLTSFTDPLGARTQYQYDSNHNLTRITAPNGNVVQQVTYDSAGRVINYLEDGAAWIVSYNPSQKRTTKRDARGSSWTFVYNDNKNITSVIDPFNSTETVNYDANFNVTSVSDKKGGLTRFKYDNTGNVTDITNPGNQVTQLTYHSTLNLVTSVKNPAGHTTAFEYDPKGNLTKLTDAAGSVTRITYDSSGLMNAVDDPLGNTTTFSYDANGNLVKVIDELGNTASMTYNTIGTITSMTDALNRQTQYSFDAANHLTQIIDAQGDITRFTSDANGNMTAFINAAGISTLFEYDAFNRLTKVTNPLGLSKTYSYDSVGNLASTVDFAGQTISYTYDALNRLLTKNMAGNTVRFTYDRSGNMLSTTDNDSSVTFAYDTLNRVITTGGSQPATTLQYTYDADSNRKTMTDSQGRVTEYTYDALLRLTNLKAFGQTINFSYDKFSRRTGTVYPNGLSAASSYDEANRLKVIDVSGSSGRVAQFTYQHDKVGNRVSEGDSDGAHSYLYDALSRLVSATHSQPQNPTESFSYNKADNRTASHLSGTYHYDNANRLLEDAVFTYAYNPAGMLIQKTQKANQAVTKYSYDPEGQLLGIEFPDGGNVVYKYDGLGRRIEKNVRGQSTRYVYDVDDIVSEHDVSNSVVATYTHGAGTDEPLIMERGGQKYFYHQDSIGNTRFLTGASGAVVQSYVYDSYGNIVAQTGSLISPYTYTGREFDAESGLYYYRARYYDARIGRFIQEDPVGFAGGQNFYAYVANNPINYVDPEGQWVQILIGAGASVATGFLISKLTGDCYSWKEALIDAGTGAAGAGLLNKFRNLNRLRQLRNVAKSEGLVDMGRKGYVETWKGAANQFERLKIKHAAGKSAGLESGSSRPRFEYRIGQGSFWDPFTGATGPRGTLSHIPLQAPFPSGASAGAGTVTGGAAGASRSGSKDCGCK